MQAIVRQSRISPKKARVVAQMVKGKEVKQALDILMFTPKKAAKIIYKLVDSAAANAKNNFNQSIDTLVISSIEVNKATVYRRHVPRSRGRVAPRRKPTSHIKVEVAVKTPQVAKEKKSLKQTKEKVETKQ